MNEFPILKLNFPERHEFLWQTLKPPPTLYIQGQTEALKLLDHLPERGLAIVGTRHPSARSKLLLREWILKLKGSNLIILSGLAVGIDAVAHETALDAGLSTVAILGGGLHIDYPWPNRALRKRILKEGGLLISEFEPTLEPRAHHFIYRNRLIAGWSKAVWVVEAKKRSGALNTATWAKKMDRDLYTVPCFPGDPDLSGNQWLLEEAGAFSFWNPQSLSSTWLELATSTPDFSNASHWNRQNSDCRSLTSFIHQESIQRGGARYEVVANWFHDKGWHQEHFFDVLRNCMVNGAILEKNGVFLALTRSDLHGHNA